MKAVFLDQGGTLVADLPEAIHAARQEGASAATDPRRMVLCCGAGPALRLLSRLDYRLFAVGGHDDVAFGRAAPSAMEAVADRLHDLVFRERLALDGVYGCPHHPDGSVAPFATRCHCRVPKPGLLLQAAQEHGIDLRASWMIGDLLHDIEAGNRAGCRTILLDNGNETEWRLGPRRIPTRMAPDLFTAALLIASHGDVS